MTLGVNVDHVATLRQARARHKEAGRRAGRAGFSPDPVEAAQICQMAGAHAVVMHLREDRRHIQESDLFRVKEKLAIKLNLEMALAPSVVKIAARLKPKQVTLVPEKRQEMTTESGLDLFKNERAIRRSLEVFRKNKIVTSFFIDPDDRQIEMARRLGGDAVEFHTGCYANATSHAKIQKELKRLKKAVASALRLGITAHAGHGLDYENIKPVLKIQGIQELNIGYSIVTRALWVGLDQAVREMLQVLA